MKKLTVVLIICVAVAAVAALGIVFRQTGDRENIEMIAKVNADKRLNALKKQRPEEFAGADGEAAVRDYREKFEREERFNELVRREAASRGISVSAGDNRRMAEVADQLMEKVTARLRVSSTEVREYYENNFDRFIDHEGAGERIPLAKVAEDIKKELLKRKKAAAFEQYLEKLREKL